MKADFYLVFWKLQDHIGTKLFRNEEDVDAFVERLKESYELLGLDWDLAITTRGISVEE